MLKKLFVISLLFLAVHSYMSRDFFGKDERGNDVRRPIRSELLGWRKYIRNLAQEYIYEIEDFGLCNLHLVDFTQNISRNFFGYEVNGTIQYTNGFFGTLQSVHYTDSFSQALIHENLQTTLITTKLIINDLMLYFDFAANLTKTYFSGTVAIPIESIEFYIKIEKEYKIDKITGTVYNANARIPYKNMRWYYEPANAYTEIMDRDVVWSLFDDLQRLSNTTLKKLLTNVIRRNTYPQICLDCNEKMQLFEYNLKEQENY